MAKSMREKMEAVADEIEKPKKGKSDGMKCPDCGATMKNGKCPSCGYSEKKPGPKDDGIKKSGVDKKSGKSNKLGYGGRSAQMKREGVPGGVIGAIARSEGAAPGGPNYHGGKKGK